MKVSGPRLQRIGNFPFQSLSEQSFLEPSCHTMRKPREAPKGDPCLKNWGLWLNPKATTSNHVPALWVGHVGSEFSCSTWQTQVDTWRAETRRSCRARPNSLFVNKTINCWVVPLSFGVVCHTAKDTGLLPNVTSPNRKRIFSRWKPQHKIPIAS